MSSGLEPIRPFFDFRRFRMPSCSSEKTFETVSPQRPTSFLRDARTKNDQAYFSFLRRVSANRSNRNAADMIRDVEDNIPPGIYFNGCWRGAKHCA